MLLNIPLVRKKICKEVSAGRVAGPFKTPPMDKLHISPLGLVPKKAAGEFRLIHDLSFPKKGDLSVNGGIDKIFTSVEYETLDHVVTIIQSVGKGCFIAKADLESAFRILPIHPNDHRLLGFKFEGMDYYDKCLAMGCSTWCADFEKFSCFIQWVLINKYQIEHMSHILDDFIFIHKEKSACQRALSKFMLFCTDLNVPVNVLTRPWSFTGWR